MTQRLPGPPLSVKQKLAIGFSVFIAGIFGIGVIGALVSPGKGSTTVSVSRASATLSATASPSATPSTASPSPSPSPTTAPPTSAAPTTVAPTTQAPAPAPTTHAAAVPTEAAPAPTQAAPAPTTAAAAPAGSCAPHTTGACGWDAGVPPQSSGETATCNDGTVSYSAHFSGTCSHHHGVEYWYK